MPCSLPCEWGHLCGRGSRVQKARTGLVWCQAYQPHDVTSLSLGPEGWP